MSFEQHPGCAVRERNVVVVSWAICHRSRGGCRARVGLNVIVFGYVTYSAVCVGGWHTGLGCGIRGADVVSVCGPIVKFVSCQDPSRGYRVSGDIT